MSDDPDRTRAATAAASRRGGPPAPREGAPSAPDPMRWARRTLSGFRQLGGAVLSGTGLRTVLAGRSAGRQGSMPTEFFDSLYADDPDPWQFTASA
jgi:hypothetical protein